MVHSLPCCAMDGAVPCWLPGGCPGFFEGVGVGLANRLCNRFNMEPPKRDTNRGPAQVIFLCQLWIRGSEFYVKVTDRILQHNYRNSLTRTSQKMVVAMWLLGEGFSNWLGIYRLPR